MSQCIVYSRSGQPVDRDRLVDRQLDLSRSQWLLIYSACRQYAMPIISLVMYGKCKFLSANLNIHGTNIVCVCVYPSISLPPRVFVRQWEDVTYEF